MKWKVEEGYLVKTFELESFTACVDMLNKVTDIAKELAHHPDVVIENYRSITFRLRTHDKDAITLKDHELSEMIDSL